MKTNPSDGEERDFLHEVASLLTTAHLTLEILIEDWQSREGEISADLQQLTKAHGALDKMKTLLLERRRVLVERDSPAASVVLVSKKLGRG